VTDIKKVLREVDVRVINDKQVLIIDMKEVVVPETGVMVAL
jgi:hypothetical protein